MTNQACITDWNRRFPLADVAAWSGNTVAVAMKHYLRATDDIFRAPTGGALGVLNSSEAPQGGVQARVLPASAALTSRVPKHTQLPMKWQDEACAGNVVHAGADTAEVRKWTVLDSNQ